VLSLSHVVAHNHKRNYQTKKLNENKTKIIKPRIFTKNSSKKSRLAISLEFEGRVISFLTEAHLAVTKIKHFLTNATCLS